MVTFKSTLPMNMTQTLPKSEYWNQTLEYSITKNLPFFSRGFGFVQFKDPTCAQRVIFFLSRLKCLCVNQRQP